MNLRRLLRPRVVLALLAVCLLVLFGRPVFHLGRTAVHDRNTQEPIPTGFVDDASRLNQTRVKEVWDIPSDPAAAERQLAALLRRAKAEKLPVSIAGARHSMGGHTIVPDGTVINMLPFKAATLDPGTNILHVQAGARWADIIPYLDQHGRSVAVMQSNNTFSVGGSISVNAHGWQPNHPPIASTVEAFRLLRDDGSIVRCSRTENAELFSLVLGGYGLFGVILDVDLRVVPNTRYRLGHFVIPSDRYVDLYEREVNQRSDVGMVFGRLDVTPDNFLREATLNVFYRDPENEIPPLTPAQFEKIRRTVFRGTVGSDYGKELRWDLEKRLASAIEGKVFSRNQLINEGIEAFENRSAESTDILHEYFIPPRQLGAFLERLRVIIPEHHGDLLNVTIRNVHPDDDSFLRYVDQEVFGLVMLFNQKRTPEGEKAMKAMTQALIDAALDEGGTYYLPYRLHATPEQFARAYPQGQKFFERKRAYDPDELFQNEFYRMYGRP
ncbi:MAG: FAD-binding oxidoreductase [Chloroflexota bacterium]|nr:FAD-binding oxidoreductase [Chloroflexota bacterium]